MGSSSHIPRNSKQKYLAKPAINDFQSGINVKTDELVQLRKIMPEHSQQRKISVEFDYFTNLGTTVEGNPVLEYFSETRTSVENPSELFSILNEMIDKLSALIKTVMNVSQQKQKTNSYEFSSIGVDDYHPMNETKLKSIFPAIQSRSMNPYPEEVHAKTEDTAFQSAIAKPVDFETSTMKSETKSTPHKNTTKTKSDLMLEGTTLIMASEKPVAVTKASESSQITSKLAETTEEVLTKTFATTTDDLLSVNTMEISPMVTTSSGSQPQKNPLKTIIEIFTPKYKSLAEPFNGYTTEIDETSEAYADKEQPTTVNNFVWITCFFILGILLLFHGR